MRNQIVLALDIGTSSTRVLGFDLRGTAIPTVQAHVPYSATVDSFGRNTLAPRLLISAAIESLDAALNQARALKLNVAAVGTASFWHSCLGVTNRGTPTTDIITWADTRSSSFAHNLIHRFGAGRCHSSTGAAIHTSYYPARLHWLRATQPNAYVQTAMWLSPPDYLYSLLFGSCSTSVSMASGTGLLNQHTCQWDDAWLKALEVSAGCLPPVLKNGVAAGLLPRWRRRWPELANVPFTHAIGDGAAGCLGSACFTRDRFAVNIGTSGAMRALWTETDATIPPDLWCYRLDANRVLMGGAFSDGGNVFNALRRLLNVNDIGPLIEQASKRRPGAHGLTVLPFMAGQRSPGWRLDSHGTVHGITLATSALDIVQAWFEAVCLQFRTVYDAMTAHLGVPGYVVLSGGVFAHSLAWQRTMADAMGRTVSVFPNPEATARGAALTAAEALGAVNFRTRDHPGRVVHPREANREGMQRAYEKQQRLYHLLDQRQI